MYNLQCVYTFTAEKLWDAMLSLKGVKLNDQMRMNFALNSTNQQWDLSGAEASTGTNQDGLKVALFHNEYICREKCTFKALVWHVLKHGNDHSTTSENPTWFLNSERIKNFAAKNITGVEWLKSISISDSIENMKKEIA